MSFCDKICAAVIVLGVLFLGKSIVELQHNNFGLKAQLTLQHVENNYGLGKN